LVNTGNGIAYITSSTAYGEWEFDVNKVGAGNTCRIQFISSTTSTYPNFIGYRFSINNDESIEFRSFSGASSSLLFQTTISYISFNVNYRIKITRTLDGTFTVYIKGGAFGWDSWTTVVASSGTNPVTNNTYTTSNYFVCDLDNGDQIRNLTIDGVHTALSTATQSSGT